MKTLNDLAPKEKKECTKKVNDCLLQLMLISEKYGLDEINGGIGGMSFGNYNLKFKKIEK